MKHIISALSLSLTLAACSQQVPLAEYDDPIESVNRATHNVNVSLDKVLIKPVANTYGKVVPDPLRRGLSNVSDTLSLPGVIANDVLQFKLGDALHNTARFAINATLGLGGLLDAASDGNLEERDTDFGETLHVWGLNEGSYVVLPVYGASTTRDSVGLLVDTLFDPLGSVLNSTQAMAKTGLKVADIADKRYRYSDIYESVVYESADGYAQLRLSYLDKRRFDLGVSAASNDTGTAEDPAFDIYEDFYE